MERDGSLTTSARSSPSVSKRLLKGATATASGIVTFLAIYNAGAAMTTWLLSGRVIHRGERDYVAEVLMLLLVTIASSAGGVVASRLDRTQPLLVASVVGAFAATSLLIAYVAHDALVPFLGVIMFVALLAAVAGGFGFARWRSQR